MAAGCLRGDSERSIQICKLSEVGGDAQNTEPYEFDPVDGQVVKHINYLDRARDLLDVYAKQLVLHVHRENGSLPN